MARMPALQGVSEVRRAEAITDGLDACLAGGSKSEKGRGTGESQGGELKFEWKPLWICEKLGGQPGY